MSQAAEYGNPVNVLGAEAYEDRGSRAKLSNIIGATAVADLVKTTLGPKGMDKILHASDGSVTVTNDGATILSKIYVDNPAAKILVDISKGQDAEVGDGTTSVCVLAGELLREAEKLLDQDIHPQTIVEGWRLASAVALETLEKSAMDHADDKVAFREDLLNIARTTLSSKVLQNDREHFATLAVDAVLRLGGSVNLESIHVIQKAGGSLSDSFLDDGYILDKKIGIGQPKCVKDAKVLVANTAMDVDKIKIYGARVRTSSYQTVADIAEAEKIRMAEKVEKIASYGCNVFINRQLIYDYPEQLFSKNGVISIEHADFEGVERLALALGTEVVSTFDDPESVKLGHCDVLEEMMIGEDTLIRMSGLAGGKACSIILRGSSDHVLGEAERSLHDALAVLSQTVVEHRTVYGGGCAEMMMACAVEKAAMETPGKKSLAMESFAHALRALPMIIAENGGYDANELITQLRAAHSTGASTACLEMTAGGIGDAKELGILESLKVKWHVVSAATEAAEMIVRVDDSIHCAPRKRQ
uniref:CCT-beta n=1 Tax=Stygiella incarcerata TaxID=1712417 RepID=A0A192ZHD2_9EUKA|nr:T-complex protein 1 subunit beta [Stygiella incarcerata]|eukprot:TRINITY_DN1672_c0_g1_i1.p1 TRINITY_DN1672_c0_g1~~TRINITY_DN1672_c0_g1_i1.p1  ORF type:complete len:530 (-),score=181.93 TRINITY_DN1672_c0_g1_i1:194-1783(-)